FVSRSCSNQVYYSFQRTGRHKTTSKDFKNIFGFGQSAIPRQSTRQLTISGRDDDMLIRLQQGYIFDGCRMLPHIQIHRRSNEHRAFGRKITRCQQIIAKPLAKFCKGICVCWSYQHEIRLEREIHMIIPSTSIRITLCYEYRLFRKRRSCERCDERCSSRRHHHLNLCPCFDQQADKGGYLVSSNT